MIPPFELHRPSTLAEVVELRTELGDEAALLGGGTELLLVMKLGLADYSHLIDIKRVPDLARMTSDEAGLHIGAAVTHRQIERSPEARSRWAQLAAMEGRVANIRVRNVGTLGGNLCFADPHSDPATFLVAADAELTCWGPSGQRIVPMADFTLGMYESALAPEELLVSIDIPPVPTGAGLAHRKLCLRERPTVTVSAFVRGDGEAVREARLVVGSVSGRPTRSADAEAQLVGMSLNDPEPTRLAAAADAAAADVDPMDDDTASADYKRQLVRVLTERTVQEAASEAVVRRG